MTIARHSKTIPMGALIVSFAAVILAGRADALTTSTTFNVTATISNSCTVVASGNIGPLTEVTHTGTNTVTITCNNGTGWTVDFAGANDSAGQNALPFHYMKDTGANYIEYILTGAGSGWTFSDPSNRLAHDGASPPTSFKASGTGDGTGQAATITATATSGAVPYSITTAATGAYSDTVTVTVTF